MKDELTADERQLLAYYRRLNADGKQSLMDQAYMHTLWDGFAKHAGKVITMPTDRSKRE